MTEYIIIFAETKPDLVTLVNDKIQAGFKPCGGPFVSTRSGHTFEYNQAMMREGN